MGTSACGCAPAPTSAPAQPPPPPAPTSAPSPPGGTSGCWGASSGPCHVRGAVQWGRRHSRAHAHAQNLNNGVCYALNVDARGAEYCPAGTVRIAACGGCVGGTAGPCKNYNNGVCYAVYGAADGAAPGDAN